MSELPPRVQELISTTTREEIFKMIDSQLDGFTFHDVYTALKNKGVNVSITSVQNLLKALSYRGYLKEYALKKTKTPGRSTIHYKKQHHS
ncbi:MAG: transcriptional repressor [Cyclobacteriaceae bacterium]